MRILKHLLFWPLTAAFAVAVGSAAVTAGNPGPDVLTASQVSDRLAQARATSAPPSDTALAKDEWYGLLPTASVIARCTNGAMELVRWTGTGLRDIERGPATTVSGTVIVDDNRITFTGRCMNDKPTGTYQRWALNGAELPREAPQKLLFGKWERGLSACRVNVEPLPTGGTPAPCRTLPLWVLSPAPGSSAR